MIREGQRVQSMCDYILTGEDVKWKNCRAIDIQFPTDHRMVKGKLLSKQNRKYVNYMKERKEHGIDIYGENEWDGGNESDKILKELHDALSDDLPAAKKYQSWISEETFQILRDKSKALQKGESEITKVLKKELRKSLRQDRRNRIWNVSQYIEGCMEKKDIIGAFDVLRNWYRNHTGKTLKPCESDLENTRKHMWSYSLRITSQMLSLMISSMMVIR